MTFKSLSIGSRFSIGSRTYTKTAPNFASTGDGLRAWFPPVKNACSFFSQASEVKAI
jgi:hypothetical protein